MAFRSLSLPLSLVYYLAAVSSVKADDPAPLAAVWSDLTFGPDGPWPAVEVTLGSSQTIALYPGREFASFLLTSDYCNGNTTCTATKAHLYNKAQAQVDNTGSTGQIQYSPGPDFMSGVDMDGENAQMWIDNMQIGSMTVPNVSLALLSSSYAVYPDNTWYPLSVGCLGIGAPKTVNQTFTLDNNKPAINASLIPGWLHAKDQIPSNSFAMHIGSANPPMPGSLYFGGYDQNRIIGDILTETDDYTKAIPLKDISITVVDGSSPWDFKSKDGLLAANNASISSSGILVSVDGCSPYLTLPQSTCDGIAEHLPVKFNKDLGLYIWQEDDPKYSQIVSSASTLDFTFLGNSNTQRVTISVPFRHLNLTLSQPLVDTDQQYFPCYTGPSGGYTLGRAFLQDAFVGANWDSKTWWLAQAPGPNIPTAQVVTLAETDTEIQASKNDWKESWSGSWKALSPEDVASTATPSPTPSPTPSNKPSGSSGLSTGAAAGIGVGVGIVGLAIIAALAFFLYRRRKASSNAKELDAGASNGDTTYPPHETAAGSYNPQNGTPQQGYYAPLKNPGAPGSPPISEAYSHTPNSMDPSVYSQQYAEQYPQQYPQQYAGGYAQPYPQQYGAELPGGVSQATELPATDMHSTPAGFEPPVDRQPSPNLNHELPSSPR
ncbi:acid protease [Nemania sp. NC0429]|nr:acid protease [Nemania sp. NC0429]